MLILLVDDDSDQLAIREMLVERFGFHALRAQTRDEALAAVRKQTPDYALVDLRLPDEMTGLRLIRELKQMSPALRVSVLTGANISRLEERPERALIEEVFQKGQSSLPELLKRLQAELRSITH